MALRGHEDESGTYEKGCYCPREVFMIFSQNYRSFKRTSKSSWAWFCTFTHLPDLYLRVRHSFCGSAQVPILLYHRVIPSEKLDGVFSLPSIIVRQDTFEKQMRLLAENYRILSLNEFFELRSKTKPPPPKTAIITFDDGREDNYLYAFPILKKYGLPATIFLATEFIGKAKVLWQERVIFLFKKLLSSPRGLREVISSAYPEEIKRLLKNINPSKNGENLLLMIIEHLKVMDEDKKNFLVDTLQAALDNPGFPFELNAFLNWEQIQEMGKFQISFGSHGANHRILTRLKEDEIIYEIVSSKKLIEKELGMAIRVFAYPNGNYNGMIIKALMKGGYQSAVTVDPGINTWDTDLYRLKRINIHEGTSSNVKGNFCKELFAVRLAGLL